MVGSAIPAFRSAGLGSRVALHRGDITLLNICAIVNAANNKLLGGGGVDGAIHRAAGKELLAECRALNGCETGQAKITKGYNLPAKHVIHTVGPFGEKPDLLKDAYTNSLKVLVENDLKTIAFPCISTGVYHYPNEAAAHVAITAVKDALLKHSLIEKVIFCVFLEKDFEIYSKLLEEYFPKNGDKNEL